MELTVITIRIYKRDRQGLVWVFGALNALLGSMLNSDIVVGFQKTEASKSIKAGKKGKVPSQKSRVRKRK